MGVKRWPTKPLRPREHHGKRKNIQLWHLTMIILVTGVAGFIGYHLAAALLQQGHRVIGVDCLTPYYDISLKEARLQALAHPHFTLYRHSISDLAAMQALREDHPEITTVLHMAAQAGVRYSLQHPFSYADSNLVGHLAVLELCRHLPQLQHLVYASSSSVYGANSKLPSSPEDMTDSPISLYAATKKSVELMSHSYSHLYGIPATGLRFFTVYGPWGRPDMAPHLFTGALFANTPINVFNHGHMRRNFTYIDDIVAGTLACMAKPPSAIEKVPHAVYNLGNHSSVPLLEFIDTLAKIAGKSPILNMLPMQPGDVQDTVADITTSQDDFGFDPKTDIAQGLQHFVDWYRHYYRV
jgi:UDP-glucuronate 4-epimerase